MSNQKNLISKKAAAGAALVALSGFVPQPMLQQAQAATATISVTGSFVTGVQLAAGADVQFGVLAATGANGSASIDTAGTLQAGSKVVNSVGGAPQAGSFAFTVVSLTPPVDFTLTGLGDVGALAASAGGNGPTGTVKLNKIIMDGIGAAPLTFSAGGGTSDKVVGYAVTGAKTATLLVGGQLTWGATAPIGSFTVPIVLTAAY